MDEYELLIRHAQAWATKTKRPLDGELLETALNLRDTQDRAPGTSWPAGSAEHLMTVRWPGHGPLGVPDVDALVDTLETYWRFLRATGRMASGSADTKVLAKEARRAIPEMRTRCEDPAGFGSTKVLQQFGLERGISLDGATSMDELNERLQLIVDQWNGLPEAERLERMPGPVGAGSVVSQEMTEQANAWLRELADDPGLRGPYGTYNDEFDDEDDDDLVPPQDPHVVAGQVRGSLYWRRLIQLVEWVGRGREATKSGMLRPAVARQAIADLGLDVWLTDDLGMSVPEWRSAGDHLGLDRLFLPAIQCELLEHRGARIVRGPISVSDVSGVPDGSSADDAMPDEAFVELAMVLLVSVFRRGSWSGSSGPLPGVLLSLAFQGVDNLDELRTWWRRAPANPLAHLDEVDEQPEAIAVRHRFSDESLDRCFAYWRDTGIWTESDSGRFAITELGRDFLRVIVGLMDRAPEMLE